MLCALHFGLKKSRGLKFRIYMMYFPFRAAVRRQTLQFSKVRGLLFNSSVVSIKLGEKACKLKYIPHLIVIVEVYYIYILYWLKFF